MSAFSNLFGCAQLDENVDLLMKGATGPVGRQDLKKRTVVEIPEKEEEEESEESEEESEESSNGESEESESEEEKESENESEVTASATGSRKRKSEDDNEDLEAQYYSKLLAEESDSAAKRGGKEEKKEKVENSENSKDADAEDSKVKSDSKQPSAKSVDLKEDELRKAECTVFVGNVSNNVITSKPTYKLFKRLFSNLGKVESIRFRSIAFDEAVPRKVAFAKKSLHSTRDTVNAYVVFQEKEPSRKAPGRLNATVFDHHHLRVDHVAHPAPKDNKRTIFVGNLDFEETEEALWRYFNAQVDDDVEAVRVVRDAKTNVGKGFALVQFRDTLSVNKALMLNDKPMAADDKKKLRKLRILRARASKPSVLSPNHVDNARKAKKAPKLSDDQKTKLGRARALLGKADRSTAGRFVAEGARAVKGQKIAGIKGLKSAKGRVKKPRITDRSSRFKKDRAELAKMAK